MGLSRHLEDIRAVVLPLPANTGCIPEAQPCACNPPSCGYHFLLQQTELLSLDSGWAHLFLLWGLLYFMQRSCGFVVSGWTEVGRESHLSPAQSISLSQRHEIMNGFHYEVMLVPFPEWRDQASSLPTHRGNTQLRLTAPEQTAQRCHQGPEPDVHR